MGSPAMPAAHALAMKSDRWNRCRCCRSVRVPVSLLTASGRAVRWRLAPGWQRADWRWLLLDRGPRLGCEHRPMARFEIRPAQAGDAWAMAELFASVAEERDGIATEPPVDIDVRAAVFARSAGESLVAVTDGQIVGMVHIEVSRHGFGELGMLVGRGWRGRGAGSALMAAAIGWARSQGLHKLCLEVFAHNGRDRALPQVRLPRGRPPRSAVPAGQRRTVGLNCDGAGPLTGTRQTHVPGGRRARRLASDGTFIIHLPGSGSAATRPDRLVSPLSPIMASRLPAALAVAGRYGRCSGT